MYRLIIGLVVAAFAAAGLGLSAHATTIEFHDGSVSGPQLTSADLNCISANGADCYGNRANGPTSTNGTSYVPDGNTPNIAATYTGALRQWNNGFGQSTYLSTDNTNPSYLTLTADAGFKISLTSITLDIDHLFGASNTGIVDIFAGGIPGGGDTPLQSLSITGTAPVTTALALLASEFTIRLSSWNYGLQSLTFQQAAVATTPIPAALPLFASALAGLGVFSWRRKKAATAA
jgi:hypothetical protein